MTAIVAAAQAEDLSALRALMSDYAATLDVHDRCFQNMHAELANLPGDYASPDGALLIARAASGDALGCVALRRLEASTCEMKRLYVRPEAQGQGLGRKLAQAAIGQARTLGYVAMRLDTLATMQAAQGLYRALGFRPIGAYNANPVPGIVFFELEL